jgi:hypothetical protein
MKIKAKALPSLSFGKGEVVSSILTGSTSNSPFHQANLVQPVAVPLTNAT